MAEYESVILANPELDEDGVESLKANIEAVAGQAGAQLEDWEVWGRRRLAYRINKQPEAIYLLMRLKGEPSVIERMRQSLKMDANLLRYMFVRKN